MLIAITIVASVLIAAFYTLILISGRSVLLEQLVDTEAVVTSVEEHLGNAGPSRIIKLCDNLSPRPFVLILKKMMVEIDNPENVKTIADAGRSELLKISNDLKRFKPKRSIVHVMTYSILAALLYVDGMQTGWVIGPTMLVGMYVTGVAGYLLFMKFGAAIELEAGAKALDKLVEILRTYQKDKE